MADALEGVASQVTNLPPHLTVEVVGYDTDEALFAPSDVDEVHIVPSMYGGGGKFFGIILGGLMIAAAVVFAPAAGVFASALTSSLFVSGALMVVQGVVGLFMKAPTISKAEDPPASKYLGISQNTTAQGTPITLACGRINLSGHWLSLQSDADKLSFGVYPATPT
ncbi:hypothetical protein [Sphingopyxis flava]|uniref:hypothetical protein n=1 Tax=Sphingopyxis flava TaxID=1507287 RepID=UPI001115F1DE|nr:hypothetical protein [Sphingopyxis flava]